MLWGEEKEDQGKREREGKETKGFAQKVEAKREKRSEERRERGWKDVA